MIEQLAKQDFACAVEKQWVYPSKTNIWFVSLTSKQLQSTSNISN